MRDGGDGSFGCRRRSRRECKGAQTSVEAAEPGVALSAPPRAGSAQERPRETKRLFGHRAVPQREEHGPDLRRGHRAPTRAEEIQDVVAVLLSRSSTVRSNNNKRGNGFSSACFSLISGGGDGRCGPKMMRLYLVATFRGLGLALFLFTHP